MRPRRRPQRGHDIEHLQSNHEGVLVDAIHGARGRCAAIVFNAGAFSHYAYALTDALDDVRRSEGRGAPFESVRAGGVAAPLGDRARRRRHDRRAPGGRVPIGRRRGGHVVGGTNMTVATTALAALDVGSRLGRLQDCLDEAAIDALLVTKLANVRYLTGFTGSAANAAGHARRRAVRHRRPLHRACEGGAGGSGCDKVPRSRSGSRRSAQSGTSWCASSLGRMRDSGLEDHSVTWAQQIGFAAAFEGVDLVPAGELVEGLRRVKDAGRGRPDAAGVRDRRRRVPVVAPEAGGTSDRAAVRGRARVRDARARCEREQLRSDHRVRSERREAAPRTERSRHRAQRAHRVRLRLHRRRATAPT